MPGNIAIWPYVLIFLWVVAISIGFPTPEEIPIIVAGAWVSHPESGLYWWIMLPVCIVSVVVSDGVLYLIGRFGGARLLQFRWIKKMLPDAKRERIERNFQKYGVQVLLFARFTPAIRGPIFIMAGAMRMSLVKFLIADGIYAIPGVTLLFFLAFWFGDQFRELFETQVNKYKPLLFLIGLTIISLYLLYRFLRRPMAVGEPEDVPVIAKQVAETIEGTIEKVSSKAEITLPPKPELPATDNGAVGGSPSAEVERKEDPARQTDV